MSFTTYYALVCLFSSIFFKMIIKDTMQSIENNGNTIISITLTLTPEKIIKIIIITRANNNVVPFTIITDASKYPKVLFLNNNIPDNIPNGTINPKSIACITMVV